LEHGPQPIADLVEHQQEIRIEVAEDGTLEMTAAARAMTIWVAGEAALSG